MNPEKLKIIIKRLKSIEIILYDLVIRNYPQGDPRRFSLEVIHQITKELKKELPRKRRIK